MKIIGVSIVSILLLTSCRNDQTEAYQPKALTALDSNFTAESLKSLVTEIDSNFSYLSFDSLRTFKSHHPNCDCTALADAAKFTKNYIQGDFDGNGYTDLLVTSRYKDSNFRIFTIFSEGPDKFEIKMLTRGSIERCRYPVRATDNDEIISLYAADFEHREKIIKTDLIYKFGNFVEYNPKPSMYDIEKINISFSGCLGTCPVFDVSIDKNGNAELFAEEYNYPDPENPDNELKGTFKTKLSAAAHDEIRNILNYIDFPKLNDEYSVFHTCASTATLEVVYNNGKRKTINDYGEIGTFGLIELYEAFRRVRFSEDWVEDKSAPTKNHWVAPMDMREEE